MQVLFTRGDPGTPGLMQCERDDRSGTRSPMPEQGILPHDLLHFVVETHFRFKNAFFGKIRHGADISYKMEHSSAQGEPTNEAWQVESMVEALQSLLWSGQRPISLDDFRYMTLLSCENRGIPCPVFDESSLESMRDEIERMEARWNGLRPGDSIELRFSV